MFSNSLLFILHPNPMLSRTDSTCTGQTCTPRDRASSSLPNLEKLIRLIVRDQQVTMLIIAMRELVRNLDDVERVCCLVEDLIHLFEGAVGGLGEEEPDAGDDGGVYYSKDNVCFIADVCKGHWCHLVVWTLAYVLEREDWWERTMTTMKLKIQFADVAIALAGARIFRGVISAGYSQVIPSHPTAKNELKTKRKTA